MNAVRLVASGEAMLSPSVTRTLLSHFGDDDTADRRRSAGDDWPSLTDREREVAIEVGSGASNAEVAASLFMSEATVKAHVSRLLTKLDVATGYRSRSWSTMLDHEPWPLRAKSGGGFEPGRFRPQRTASKARHRAAREREAGRSHERAPAASVRIGVTAPPRRRLGLNVAASVSPSMIEGIRSLLRRCGHGQERRNEEVVEFVPFLPLREVGGLLEPDQLFRGATSVSKYCVATSGGASRS